MGDSAHLHCGEANEYVGLTDRDWFNFLNSRTGLEEVNFWQASATTTFAALAPGAPFLFKLHSPDNYIVSRGKDAFLVYIRKVTNLS